MLNYLELYLNYIELYIALFLSGDKFDLYHGLYHGTFSDFNVNVIGPQIKKHYFINYKIKNCYINKYVNLMLSCTQKQIVMKKNAVHYKNKYNNGKKDKVDQKEQNIKNYIEK